LTTLQINCFRAIISTTPEDLLPAVYLCTNRVAPAHYGIELGIGEGILFKALAAATGRTEQRIKDALKEDGDLGTVAVKFKSSQKTFGVAARLTVRGVFKSFKEIATVR
jgi:DNA ligase-1